jgi:hypothetical protein
MSWWVMLEIAALSTAAMGVANKYGNGEPNEFRKQLRDYEVNQRLENHAKQGLGLMNTAVGSRPVNPNAGIPTLMSKRLVRVFLVDPNESVPLDASMLYKSDEKLTDLTDQELFFEIPVQELLAKHNALRVTTVDKAGSKRSNKDVFLEPAKIRDLTMTVLVLETW